jgi:GNAT superfamily N-acetyltransferase
MRVNIKEVHTRRDLKKFIRFPHRLYRGNPYRVPPLFVDEYRTLRSDKNPAFDHCEAKYWLAYRDGRIAGRIAAIANERRIETWKERYMQFGWLDFINDEDISEALFGTVESWAREKGMTALHGPLGFTDFDPEGTLVDGFDELGTLATIYNFPYYASHLERLGYQKDIDWIEYELFVPSGPNESISRITDTVLRRYNLRKLEVKHKKDLLPYAHELFHMLNDTYQHLYGFVPLTEKQIDTYTRQYFGFINPRFVPVVLNKSGAVVAFGIAMPSVSKALQKARGRLFPFGFIYLLRALKRNDRADLYLVSVKSEYQGKGVNAILIDEINKVFNDFGIKKVESNPELETNRLVQEQWKYFEKRQHKRRRCYIKHLV